jgi:hypothetical protein
MSKERQYVVTWNERNEPPTAFLKKIGTPSDQAKSELVGKWEN